MFESILARYIKHYVFMKKCNYLLYLGRVVLAFYGNRHIINDQLTAHRVLFPAESWCAVTRLKNPSRCSFGT